MFLRFSQALVLAERALADVAKVNVWLADARDFGAFNRVYMECFGEHRPARSNVAACLMIDAKVEIDVTAYKQRGWAVDDPRSPARPTGVAPTRSKQR